MYKQNRPFVSAYSFYNQSTPQTQGSPDYPHMSEYASLDKRTSMQDFILQDYLSHPPYSAFSPGFAFTIDHILYQKTSEKGARGHLEPVELLEVPSRQEINEGVPDGMPDQQCPSPNLPSDHFRIEAVFEVCL